MSQKTTPAEIPETKPDETTTTVPDQNDSMTDRNISADKTAQTKKDIKNTLATKRRRKKLRKLIIWLVVLIILATSGFFIWKNFFNKSAEKEDAGYSKFTVSRRDIIVTLPGTGAVEPVNSYTVSGLVKGEILEAPFSEGDHIEKGALLYRIDSSSIESSVERARLNVERAQISYDDLMQSQKDLTVSSDYAGVVQELYVEVGDEVKAGDNIAQILDKDTMLIDLSFFSVDAKRIAVGQAAKITVESNLEQLDGVVKEISPVDTVGENGSLIRTVTLSVRNPGGLTETGSATAQIGDIACFKGGTFKYNVNELIKAKTSGEVQKLNFKEGQFIRKGVVLAQLASDTLDTQMKNSALSLKDAQSSLQSSIDQADDYYITSPISGTVIAKNYEAGETISASTGSTEMAVIYDMSSLTFSMNIDELDIGSLKMGQEVTITSDALKGEVYTGKVSKISIQGTTTNGTTTYPVTVTIDEVGNLLPGMNINASIVIKQVQNVLAIPVNAVSRGNRVKVLVKEGTDTKSDENKTTTEKEKTTATDKTKSDETKTVATANAPAQSQSTAVVNGTVAGSAPTDTGIPSRGTSSNGSTYTNDGAPANDGSESADRSDTPAGGYGSRTGAQTGEWSPASDGIQGANTTATGNVDAGGYTGGDGTSGTRRGMRATYGTDAGAAVTAAASTDGSAAAVNDSTGNVGAPSNGASNQSKPGAEGTNVGLAQGGRQSAWGQTAANATATQQGKTGTAVVSGTQTQNGKPSENLPAQNGTGEIQELPDGTKYREVFVTLGVDDDNYIEVISGLDEGDVIIIESVVVPTSNNNAFMFGGGGGGMAPRSGMAPGGTSSGTRTYGGGGGTVVTTQSSRSFSSGGSSGGSNFSGGGSSGARSGRSN